MKKEKVTATQKANKLAQAVLIANKPINPKKTTQCTKVFKTPTVAYLLKSLIKEAFILKSILFANLFGKHLYKTPDHKMSYP